MVANKMHEDGTCIQARGKKHFPPLTHHHNSIVVERCLVSQWVTASPTDVKKQNVIMKSFSRESSSWKDSVARNLLNGRLSSTHCGRSPSDSHGSTRYKVPRNALIRRSAFWHIMNNSFDACLVKVRSSMEKRDEHTFESRKIMVAELDMF